MGNSDELLELTRLRKQHEEDEETFTVFINYIASLEERLNLQDANENNNRLRIIHRSSLSNYPHQVNGETAGDHSGTGQLQG